MFDSLDEEIKATEGRGPTQRERLLRGVVIAVTTLVVFGAVYAGIVLLES